jgi:RNA polymerase sigma factor (sigma-70 family)
MKKVATDLVLVGDIHRMTTIETDAELLRRSAAEPAAFGELYKRHGVALRRYVVSRVGIGSGEDLAAEVFVRAFRTRETCRAEHESARPWLFGVANHVISDHRRLERRRLATLERLLVEERDLAGNPDVRLTPETIHALRRLPATDRDTLLLLVWGELSRDEVAAALGVPVGTVNSRIARARKRLASDLAPLRRVAPTELRLNGESNG